MSSFFIICLTAWLLMSWVLEFHALRKHARHPKLNYFVFTQGPIYRQIQTLNIAAGDSTPEHKYSLGEDAVQLAYLNHVIHVKLKPNLSTF